MQSVVEQLRINKIIPLLLSFPQQKWQNICLSLCVLYRVDDVFINNCRPDFSKSMADELGKREFTITMLLSPNTGKGMEVNFNFTTFNPYARVPLHVYREIEVKLKEQIHYEPGEPGKQLNYIMLAWMQKPKGKLPPLNPPGPLM